MPLGAWMCTETNSELHSSKLPSSDWQESFLRWLAAVGPCMGLSVHVPNGYLKVVFNWLLTSKKTNRSISHGSEDCLCIEVLRMEERKSRFRNLKWVDGTTQELVSGTFRGCKFQVCLVAKYFISENSGSCSHINFVQKVEEELILCCVLVSPLELR